MIRRVKFVLITTMPLFFLLSCNNDSHEGELQFYYYPRRNVYYDPVKKNFLYSLNGAKSWSTFSADNTDPATLGEKVVVYSNNADVYKDNDNHRKLYRGQLYNIVADTGFVAVGPEAVERKSDLKPKVTQAKKAENKKRGNGIGKFINRIFGKHK